jgi:hypothetical protein
VNFSFAHSAHHSGGNPFNGEDVFNPYSENQRHCRG